MVNKKKKLKSLAHGRPLSFRPPPSISRKVTRNLIRTYHTLEKRKAKAIADGDLDAVTALEERIKLQGGLESYQRASLIGQSDNRGGDSSKVLINWLEDDLVPLREQIEKGSTLRMLEVGALSMTNACSKSRLFDIERIDLRSQTEGIMEQDFMERPLPADISEKFDIISLSLVLNYVSDAKGKGEMLLRTREFLKTVPQSDGLQADFPSLFLVLPLPCVANSRFLDEDRLEAIMDSIGYSKVKQKVTNALVYYLWRLGSDHPTSTDTFKKIEVRSGKSRNNFAIVI